MPAPTERQITNHRKRVTYARESQERSERMVREAIACPCHQHINAAHVAIDGTINALTDARLWEGRLYGSERRHTFTIRLAKMADLRQTLPMVGY